MPPPILKPIKRVWKAPATKAVPVKLGMAPKGADFHDSVVQEKNTDSIWSTFEGLQAAKDEQESKPKWWK
jgi:hypothetical protein